MVYDLSGKGEIIFRGGWGIFYDRPQGNMVFDMICERPGRAELVGAVGPAAGSAHRRHEQRAEPDPGPEPDGVRLRAAAGDAVERSASSSKLFGNFMFDLAYVGSKSDDLLRQVQINAVPRGATFAAANQDPTRAASTVPGATALPTDLLRPYPGYGGIRMWDYSGYSNYHALQTGITRRYDDGFMFSFFYVWSKALGINNDDFTAGLPNADRRRDPPPRLLLREHRPPAQLRRSTSIYQLPFLKDQRHGAGEDRRRLAVVGRLPLDQRPPAGRRLLDPGHRRSRT